MYGIANLVSSPHLGSHDIKLPNTEWWATQVHRRRSPCMKLRDPPLYNLDRDRNASYLASLFTKKRGQVKRIECSKDTLSGGVITQRNLAAFFHIFDPQFRWEMCELGKYSLDSFDLGFGIQLFEDALVVISCGLHLWGALLNLRVYILGVEVAREKSLSAKNGSITRAHEVIALFLF